MKQWELENSENPKLVIEKLKAWQKIANDRIEFIDAKGLAEECFDWIESRDKKIKPSEIKIENYP